MRTSARRWRPLALLLLSAVLTACTDDGSTAAGNTEVLEAGTDLSQLLGRGTSGDGFQRAVPGAVLRFPRDHGPHTGFRTGWWYFTGNLMAAEGRAFGYQLTFFRIALKPGSAHRASAWGSRQVYMAHFAITDAAAGRFHRRQRLARSGLELAGAAISPFRVWLEDWRVDSLQPGKFLPLRLRARARTEAGDIALDLRLEPGKPRVLQGLEGYSAKSAEPGNASYYYSYTRLPTRGSIETPAGRYEVRGRSWFDREWSTSALSAQQAGWDWFALQLDDGRELMLYRLRRSDGRADPHSAGILVDAGGRGRPLGARDFQLRPLKFWRDPGGRRYPVAWEIRYRGLRLDVEPRLQSQAYTRGIPYWEGAVRVTGDDSGRPVSGSGYLELSGY